MAKADAIAAALALIQSEQAQALTDGVGQAYDAGAVDQKASDGTLTQADLDAAVKAATDPLNAQVAALQTQDAADAKAASDAQAALATAQQSLSDAQAQVASLQSQVAGDQVIIGGFKNVVSQMQAADQQLQAVVSALQGLSQPPPVPPAS